MKTEQTDGREAVESGAGKPDEGQEGRCCRARREESGPHSRCTAGSARVFTPQGTLAGGGGQAFSSHPEHTVLVTSTHPSRGPFDPFPAGHGTAGAAPGAARGTYVQLVEQHGVGGAVGAWLGRFPELLLGRVAVHGAESEEAV